MSGGHKPLRLREALTRLSKQERKVYIAASRDGLTYAQIAERRVITPTEVEHLLATAIARLASDKEL